MYPRKIHFAGPSNDSDRNSVMFAPEVSICAAKGQREPRDYCALNYGRYYEPVGPHIAGKIPCTCIRHCSHVSNLPVSTSSISGTTSGTTLLDLERSLPNLFSHHHSCGTIRIQSLAAW